MGNEFRRRCTNGDEVMVHSEERHCVVPKRGETSKVKTATTRRERREEKTIVRDESNER